MPCWHERRARPRSPKLQPECSKVPQALNPVGPAAPSSCRLSNGKLWESEGAGCVIHSRGVCVCVVLSRLTDVPFLRGPAIKPLCTQPQSLAYIYPVQNSQGIRNTHKRTRTSAQAHATTHRLPMLNVMQCWCSSCIKWHHTTKRSNLRCCSLLFVLNVFVIPEHFLIKSPDLSLCLAGNMWLTVSHLYSHKIAGRTACDVRNSPASFWLQKIILTCKKKRERESLY